MTNSQLKRSKSRILEFASQLMKQAGFLIFLAVDSIVLLSDLTGLFTVSRLVYVIILVLGVVVGSYQVYVKKAKEVEELKAIIRATKENRPKIAVGFREDGNLLRKLTLLLQPLPSEPDYTSLVESKRRRLLGEASSPLAAVEKVFEAAKRQNPRYVRRVEDYLEEYRTYLEDHHRYSIRKDRLRSIYPIIENRGGFPLDDVAIHIILTDIMHFSSHQELYWAISDDEEPRPPKEPDPNELFIVSGASLSASFLRDFYPMIDATVQPSALENIIGRDYELRDDELYVEYTVKRLLQHRPVADFEPFSIWLGEVTQEEAWEIPVRIFAAELPEPQTDTLTLEIRISETIPE